MYRMFRFYETTLVTSFKTSFVRFHVLRNTHDSTMTGEDMVLYWTPGSTPCWRVMIVLEEKGFINCKKIKKEFNMIKQTKSITNLNHRGQVPTFTDGKLNINESHAICDYLEYRYKANGQLIPSSNPAMCTVLQRMHEAHNNFQQHIIQNIVYYCFENKEEKRDEELLTKRYVGARKELQIWNDLLEEEKEDYIAGKEFTMADVYLYPHVAFCVHFGLDISKYPHLKEYYDRLAKRESIKNTWPDTWGAWGKEREKPLPYNFLEPI